MAGFLKFSMVVLITLFIVSACSPVTKSFKKDKAEFEASAVIMKFKSVSDMNDSYFEIKENNYFYFYRTLFDSLQNTKFAGRYTRTGDTLFLNFYNKKGIKFLGQKALINNEQKEIIFFENSPGVAKKWVLF